jgi:hypothetical protein
MDAVNLIFYAVVCGALGWAGPKLGAPVMRFGIGAGVGLVAASVLPLLKQGLGLY